MNNNPFETIKYWLDKNSLTTDEKRRMKTTLVSYVTSHPVKSGLLSPYTFRYASVALASLVIVLGGSIGFTSAAYQALPNSKLYPVKIWIEEYKAKGQKTPDAVIAFETKRIETRFNEATRLAVNQQLDDNSSAIIQAGIEHSRTAIKDLAEKIQDQNPELALSAASTLETTFSSNGKILATIEQNTNQNIGPIVLAAQVTTKKLATEKTKFEQIVALKSNNSTKDAAEKRLAEVQALLASTATPAVDTTSTANIAADTTVATPAPEAKVGVMMAATLMTASEPAPKTPREQAADLIADAQTKMNAGSYSEALVGLEKAGQILNEISLTKSLEQTYKVDVPSDSTDTTTPDTTQTPSSAPSSDTDTSTSPVSVQAPQEATTPHVVTKLDTKSNFEQKAQ